jgi:multiple sugar transport system substrate-binding protein
VRRRGVRVRGVVLALGLAMGVVAACGDEGGPPQLSWYINPDDGGQQELARRCTEAAGGQYRIATSLLPSDASSQREQLLRRLAARDGSIDLMSLDPVFVPEFAQAGFLAPIPAGSADELIEGTVDPAVTSATWRDELVAVPFWANTQLLWFRRSVVEQAGLDPDAEPVTWDQILTAAQDTGTTVGVQANRYEGYTVLINALIESAGGTVIENPGATVDDLQLGLESPAGVAAARIIADLAGSAAAGPALSTSDEEAARALFQGASGGFMVNWPYVWRAANSAVESGNLSAEVLADIGWTVYPRVSADRESSPPLGGINLGIGAWSDQPELALDAIRCITSTESQKFYMLNDGNPASRGEVFDDPEVLEAFPMAPVIRESLETSAPRPQTEYYGDVSSALQREFHPPGSVDPERTPRNAADLIMGVLRGEVLL